MLRRQVRELSSAQALRFAAVTFSDPDEAREFAGFRKACTRNRAADAHRQLFLWARAQYPGISQMLTWAGDILRWPMKSEPWNHTFTPGAIAPPGAGADLLKLVSELRNTRDEKQKNRALEAELNPAPRFMSG